ncbi:hypothetical protein CBR_g29768 [Chara braunii]|uniref:Uncharacterized protein n=1 Tax=Chara braunii TaxID=69332 RepID=A0A388LBC9_CHABU|nr:hypothetical protein CBR_g29768 [Chara braunii]|eukprot:GBG79619.1 hypothetical protein CBR_g29768 [Chara braunii]
MVTRLQFTWLRCTWTRVRSRGEGSRNLEFCLQTATTGDFSTMLQEIDYTEGKLCSAYGYTAAVHLDMGQIWRDIHTCFIFEETRIVFYEFLSNFY